MYSDLYSSVLYNFNGKPKLGVGRRTKAGMPQNRNTPYYFVGSEYKKLN